MFARKNKEHLERIRIREIKLYNAYKYIYKIYHEHFNQIKNYFLIIGVQSIALKMNRKIFPCISYILRRGCADKKCIKNFFNKQLFFFCFSPMKKLLLVK